MDFSRIQVEQADHLLIFVTVINTAAHENKHKGMENQRNNNSY